MACSKSGRVGTVIGAMFLSALGTAHAPAQFASFSATEESRLHGGVVDGTTGQPVKGAALRVLGEPKLVRLMPDEVTRRDKRIRLFETCAVVLTDDIGTVSIPSPFDPSLMIVLGNVAEDPGHLIVSARGAFPLAAEAGIAYRRLEITNRYMTVTGSVHANYLPPVGIVPHGEEAQQRGLVPQLNDLSIQLSSQVATPGRPVAATAQWKYVKLPLMQSLVQDAKLGQAGTGSGRVSERWQLNIDPDAQEPGEKRIVAVAYLDAPFCTLPAARAEANYYVAQSEAEAEAYRRVLKASAEGPDTNRQCMETCRDAIKRFPKMVVAWSELGKRLATENRWPEVLTLWDLAPDVAKQNWVLAAGRWTALQKLGRHRESDEALLAVVQCDGTPALVRVAAYQEALAKENWTLALQLLPHLGDALGRAVGVQRFFAWMSGDRSSQEGERIWVAQALAANDLPAESLAAMSELDPAKLDEYQQRSFLELGIRAHAERGSIDEAQKLLTALEKLGNAEEHKNDLTLARARIAEAKNDWQAAAAFYADATFALKDRIAAFARVVKKSVVKQPPQDPRQYTCAAFSLLAAHDFEAAREVAEVAVQRTPELPAAHLALGLALEMKGRLAEALAALKRAAGLAATDPYIKQEHQWAGMLVATGALTSSSEKDAAASPTASEPAKKDERQINRMWIDDRGRNKVQASLLKIEDGSIQLKRLDNGQTVNVSRDRLSKVDQTYIRLIAATPPAVVASREPEIEAGMQVVVTEDGAEFGLTEKSFKLPKETRVTVAEVRGVWIGGRVELDGVTQRGWIHRSKITPIEVAKAVPAKKAAD